MKALSLCPALNRTLTNMKTAIILALAVACVCGSEDDRSKRSLLLETPTFYAGAYAPWAAPIAPAVAPIAPAVAPIAPAVAPVPTLYAGALGYAPYSPVVARASRVVGLPGFVPRYPYSAYPYSAYWPGSPVYLKR